MFSPSLLDIHNSSRRRQLSVLFAAFKWQPINCRPMTMLSVYSF